MKTLEILSQLVTFGNPDIEFELNGKSLIIEDIEFELNGKSLIIEDIDNSVYSNVIKLKEYEDMIPKDKRRTLTHNGTLYEYCVTRTKKDDGISIFVRNTTDYKKSYREIWLEGIDYTEHPEIYPSHIITIINEKDL
jgi:hypothetical protein